jgi:hypothetical protein
VTDEQRGPSWAPWFAWREREPWPRGVALALAAAAVSLLLAVGSLIIAFQAEVHVDSVERCAKRLASWVAQIERETKGEPVDASYRSRFVADCSRYLSQELYDPP